MKQTQLLPEECLTAILYFSIKHNLPPEEVRRKIGERMAEEGVSGLGEYLYEKAKFLFGK